MITQAPTSNPVRSARSEAAIVALAPAVLLAGLIYHPYIGLGPPDPAVIGPVVAADPTHWGLAHLIVAIGSGLAVLAFLAIRGYLRDARGQGWSAAGVPFIVIGSTLFTLLPGLEFAPLAAAEIGANVRETQDALLAWFFPVLMAGGLLFTVGAVCFAKGIADSAMLSRPLTMLVAGSLAALGVSRFIPLAAVQFYVQAAAGVLALWPLAYLMWTRPQAPAPTRSPGTNTPSPAPSTARRPS